MKPHPHLDLLLSRAYDGALAPEHLADLRKSALAEDIIREQHIRSVPPAMIGRLLGFDLPKVTSALLFPYPSVEGGFMPVIRVKLFPPQEDGEGHGFKYAQPKGSSPRVYFVRRCLREVLEGAGRLLLVEGEKKSLSLAQLGHATIGIAGVEGWHTKGDRRLLADFAPIRLRDRVVEIVPDGDYQSNENVRRAVQRLGAALAERGARARVVLLPHELPQ
jgi:hypothetical protein